MRFLGTLHSSLSTSQWAYFAQPGKIEFAVQQACRTDFQVGVSTSGEDRQGTKKFPPMESPLSLYQFGGCSGQYSKSLLYSFNNFYTFNEAIPSLFRNSWSDNRCSNPRTRRTKRKPLPPNVLSPYLVGPHLLSPVAILSVGRLFELTADDGLFCSKRKKILSLIPAGISMRWILLQAILLLIRLLHPLLQLATFLRLICAEGTASILDPIMISKFYILIIQVYVSLLSTLLACCPQRWLTSCF